jgi:hypothetical protein
LSERDRVRKHAPDFRKFRSRQREQAVEDRQQDLVGQVQGAVAERLVQQVVRGRHGAEERVLDREASRLGPPFRTAATTCCTSRHGTISPSSSATAPPPRKKNRGYPGSRLAWFLQKEKAPPYQRAFERSVSVCARRLEHDFRTGRAWGRAGAVKE